MRSAKSGAGSRDDNRGPVFERTQVRERREGIGGRRVVLGDRMRVILARGRRGRRSRIGVLSIRLSKEARREV
jgi:hypothetical protein